MSRDGGTSSISKPRALSGASSSAVLVLAGAVASPMAPRAGFVGLTGRGEVRRGAVGGKGQEWWPVGNCERVSAAYECMAFQKFS